MRRTSISACPTISNRSRISVNKCNSSSHPVSPLLLVKTRGEWSAWVPVCLNDPMDLLCRTHIWDVHTEMHTHGPPWTQGALSFFLSLHFPAVYFGQLVARSHSAAVPMVIAVEIANGGWRGWWGGELDGERERQRCSVRRDRGLCDCRGGGGETGWGGRGDEWYGFECVSVCDATLPSRSQVASVNQCFKLFLINTYK